MSGGFSKPASPLKNRLCGSPFNPINRGFSAVLALLSISRSTAWCDGDTLPDLVIQFPAPVLIPVVDGRRRKAAGSGASNLAQAVTGLLTGAPGPGNSRSTSRPVG